MRISDWSSDVCSSDLQRRELRLDRMMAVTEDHIRTIDAHRLDVNSYFAGAGSTNRTIFDTQDLGSTSLMNSDNTRHQLASRSGTILVVIPLSLWHPFRNTNSQRKNHH